MTMICVEFTQLLAKKILCYSNVLRKYIVGTLIVHAYIHCTCTSCYVIESFISLNCVNHHTVQC